MGHPQDIFRTGKLGGLVDGVPQRSQGAELTTCFENNAYILRLFKLKTTFVVINAQKHSTTFPGAGNMPPRPCMREPIELCMIIIETM